jgi:hypothetical protein
MDNPKVATLELLKDWSKWLVAIDTAALALLGSAGKWQGSGEKTFAVIGGVAFLISLIAATFLVGAVPVLVQRVLVPALPDSPAVKTHDRESVYAFRYGPFSVETYAVLQHYSFLVAAASITVAQLLKNLR